MFQKPTNDMEREPEQNNYSDDAVQTVVGPSVHVEGDFSSEGNILVKGSVSGNVRTSKQLIVEEGAKISASVRATDAIISGEINGSIKVSHKVELTSSARVLGDISCDVLAVEAGALIFGKIIMKQLKGAEATRKKTAPKAKTRKRATSTPSESEA
mgnify:CR=1 FL=1